MKNGTSKKLLTWLSIVVAAFVIIGGGWKAWNIKADAQDLIILTMRFDQQVLFERVHELQKRIWMLEDRYRGKQMTTQEKSQLMDLRLELEEVKLKLEQLGKKGS